MDGLSLQSSERLALDLDAQVDAGAVASLDLWEAGFGAEASYYGQWCGSDLRMPATSKVSKLSASVASLMIGRLLLLLEPGCESSRLEYEEVGGGGGTLEKYARR